MVFSYPEKASMAGPVNQNQSIMKCGDGAKTSSTRISKQRAVTNPVDAKSIASCL